MPPLNMPSGLPLIAIAGPTAAGKSEVAMLLAQRIRGEIISVDSMQVYRGLDIGTAKPTLAERDIVPHHLIDIMDLAESFDAAQFVEHARRAIQEIHARGRTPILCGGTGLYFKALLEGLGEAPPGSPQVRAELEKTPLPELLRELAERDPVTFARIDRENPRRVVRALEVIRLTGKPFSAQRAAWNISQASPSLSTTAFFGLSRVSKDLHSRIEERVEKMFQRGLVEETRQLLERGLAQNRTAFQAIGYREAVDFLEGKRLLAETIALVKQRTRQFSKRQRTWFSRQAAMRWVHIAPEDTAAALAEGLATQLSC